MKKWLKKWLGITKIEDELNSIEMLAVKRYANDEVQRCRHLIEQGILKGKITSSDNLYHSNHVSYRIDIKDEAIYLDKYYNFSKNLDTYTATVGFVVFTGQEAQDFYELADKLYKI